MLEVKSSDKGFLAPRLSCTVRQSITSPANGLVIYDADMNCLTVFNGTDWVLLTSRETVACDGITIHTYTQVGNPGSTGLGTTNNLRIKTEVDGNGDEEGTYRDAYIVLKVPTKEKFNSATLRLTVQQKQNDANGNVGINTFDPTGFTETNLNWNNQPTVISQNVVTFDATNLALDDTVDIDVSALLLAAKTAGDDFLGLKFTFVNTTTSGNSLLAFYSKEETDDTKRPMLLIQ